MARPKINPEENYPICMRCNIKTPRLDSVDVSKLTAKAEYWREMPEKN